jgi:hypothetical protein
MTPTRVGEDNMTDAAKLVLGVRHKPKCEIKARQRARARTME